MKNKFLKTGTGLIGANMLVGIFPNMTDTPTETNLRSNFAEGISKTGKALPVMGKVIGTKMVLKPIIKLKKTTRGLTWDIKVVTGEAHLLEELMKKAVDVHNKLLGEFKDGK